MHDECVNIDGREYGTVHRKHDSNSVCQLALIAPVTVNIFGSFSPHAPGNIHFLNLLMDPPLSLSLHAQGDVNPLNILRYSGLPIFPVGFYLWSVISPDLLPDATPSFSLSGLHCQSIVNPLFHQFSVASYAYP